MTAKERLDAGDLGSAITQVTEEVRNNPTDARKRTFLFELLCFAGDLERARKQLDAIAAEGVESEIAVQGYRNVLEGETLRRRLFTDGRVPGLPGNPPPYVRLHLEAVNRIRENHYEEARALLEEAEGLRPSVQGTINGEPFDDLKDGNDLLGPFLEVLTTNNYSWIPWEMVRSVTCAEPKYLRDLVWLPAQVELVFGRLGEVFLPILYADSYLHSDDRVKLGRMTDWRAEAAGLALATGQKLLVASDRDWSMLEVRQIELEAMEGADADTGAGS